MAAASAPMPGSQTGEATAAAHTKLQRRISDQRALMRWKKSGAYRELVGFISSLADAVVGKKVSEECETNAAIARIVCAFDEMRSWVAEIPPIPQAMRYGNKAFKQWHARLCEAAPGLMDELVVGAGTDAATATELVAYFVDAFGNPTRIDYGTGHELSLAAWLSCLRRVGVIGSEHSAALVLRVFVRYLELMRLLQTTYWLEPAGSHGVWGLDDYQFLPFFFGAAQLINHADIRPASIHDELVLEHGHEDYLYLAAVRFVRQVKKGPFWEHSPYLNDIANLESWQRVASGLLKMYEGEVLGKLPVVQHLKFGKLLQWESPFDD